MYTIQDSRFKIFQQGTWSNIEELQIPERV